MPPRSMPWMRGSSGFGMTTAIALEEAKAEAVRQTRVVKAESVLLDRAPSVLPQTLCNCRVEQCYRRSQYWRAMSQYAESSTRTGRLIYY